MLNIGTLSFATPWLLAALIVLPVIFWILRVTPPAPRRERFPAIAFLFGAQMREETPAHTPLWLLIMRLALAALLIFALSGPSLNAHRMAGLPGPLTLIVDNGWPSAQDWERIKSEGLSLIDEAQQASRPVAIIRTAPAAAQSFAPMAAGRAKAVMQAMEPEPWMPQRMAVWKAWQQASDAPRSGRLVWLCDGIEGADGKAFAKALADRRTLEVRIPAPPDLAIALLPAAASADDLKATITRPAAGSRLAGSLTAYGTQGRIIAHETFELAAGDTSAAADFKLPLEMRNEIERIGIDTVRSAGAVTLLDNRWRRRSVGLVSGGGIESAQPLLGDLYYVERALQPYADLRKGEIGKLIDEHVQVLILADVGHIVDDDVARLTKWIDQGGVLIRFAGPNLAGGSDDLVPTELRRGGRVMGGALSWAKPQKLGAFEAGSPFYGLAVPQDVTVRRQVLAEPSLELAGRTWARLEDGTPLVTGIARGKGELVLFHVTANSDWSNLPLSGLFVDMLQRLVDMSRIGASEPAAAGAAAPLSLVPQQALDGYGVLKPAPASAQPIAPADLATTLPGPAHPPGLYGPGDAARVLNATRSDTVLRALTDFPQGTKVSPYAAGRTVRLEPWLLSAALVLALIDALIALLLMGKLPALPKLARHAAPVFIAAALLAAGAHGARGDDTSVIDAALHTHLAYIVTGDPQVDAMSRAGLQGLTERLIAKTAFEPDAPVGLDIDKDELTLFPLIYWPVTPAQKPLSPDAQRKLDQYLKTGGLVLFDTQDADEQAANPNVQTPAETALQTLLAGIDVPPLEPVPPGHVLGRSFYLLNTFPGRFADGEVWVEAGSERVDANGAEREGTVNDGVSSIVIGSNDWASAWAVDSSGRPVAPVIPGGERQRELAFRFGVNLAMYALTGNYKGDEVHTRELIKRLGE